MEKNFSNFSAIFEVKSHLYVKNRTSFNFINYNTNFSQVI